MRNLILFACLFCFGFSFAQNGEKLYLDSTFAVTSGDFAYYRITEPLNDGTRIKTFYKSDKLYSEAKTATGGSYNGAYTAYYENGITKETKQYEKGIPIGPYAAWYENGTKKIEGSYIDSKLQEKYPQQIKITNYWSDANVPLVTDGEGVFEETSNNTLEKGPIRGGFRDGTWTGHNSEFKFNFSEDYVKGILISGQSTDSLGTVREYKTIFVKPEPANGIMDFYKHVMNNMQIPDEPNLHGKIYISFTIGIDGVVTNLKVNRGLGAAIDAEAVRVVSTYTGWNPAISRGIKIPVTYSLPISIQSANSASERKKERRRN